MKWVLFLTVGGVIGAGVAVLQVPISVGGGAVAQNAAADKVSAKPANARTIVASGFVEGARREIPLRFELEGRLISVEVSEGDTVRAGDVLARLDAAQLQHERDQAAANVALAEAERERVVNAEREETRKVARAAVVVAEAKLARARTELERGEKLMSKGTLTPQAWDDLQHDYKLAAAELQLAEARSAEIEAGVREDELKMADARVQMARAALRQAETRLERATLVAPSDGLVLRITDEPGELVGPSSATPVITMANVEELRVRAYVEELDALAVRPGQPAEVAADGRPDARYRATVVSCLPCMGPKDFRNHRPGERIDVRVREVVVALSEPSDLVVGLPVEVFIQAEPEGTAVPVASEELSK